MSSGFPAMYDSNQPAHLYRLARMLKLCVASLSIVISKERIIKMLIRLCGCAGWYEPLLFECNLVRFSSNTCQIVH